MTGRSAKLPLLTILNCLVLLGALGGLIAFAAMHGRHQDENVVRLTLVANSALPAGGLQACLSKRVLLTNDGWRVSTNEAPRRQAWNSARTLEADVIDLRSSRRLEIFTRGGRSLSEDESEAVKTCLRGG